MSPVTFTTFGALGKSALRQANEQLVLNMIRHHPGVSRSEIARRTGLSRSSVTYVIGRLKRRGIIDEEKIENHSQLGRRPTALRLKADSRLAVGVEVSVAESRVVLANLAGEILKRKSVAWHKDPGIFLDRVHAAIRSVTKGIAPRRLLGCGVAIPGSIDASRGRATVAENLGWTEVDVARLVGHDLNLPVFCDNSAKLSALSERWFTEEEHRLGSCFVFVSLHSGLGTGVIIRGNLLHSGEPAAAEFGHVTLYPDGLKCGCGNLGCWEQYASDYALCRRYAGHRASSSELATPLRAETVVRLAREGDPAAKAALKETALDLARGLVNLVWALNPDSVVLGDYAAEGWDLIQDTVMPVLRQRVAPYVLSGLRIEPSRHGGESAVLGSVALVLDHFFNQFGNGDGRSVAPPVSMRRSAQAR